MKRLFSILACILIICNSVFITSYATDAESLDIKAKAYVLMDFETGKVLYCKNEHEKLYPASVTKIMSLLLFVEAIDSSKISTDDKVVTSSIAASKGGSQIWLKDGEIMTVDELLRATAIGSANDACTSLAEFISGSEESFVSLMNERAKQLKMNDTNYENCTGLDDETKNHKTSAYDIAVMSRELLKHDRIKKYSTVWMDSLRNGETQLVNTNKLVRFYKGTTGLKTGTTVKAGHCLSASAERDGLHLIAVILGAENSTDRFEGAKALLNYGFANYEIVKPDFDKKLITDVNVINGKTEKIHPKIENIKKILLKKGENNKIESKINLSVDVEAPVEKNQVLGNIDFLLGGKRIAEYKIYAEESIERIKIGDVMIRLLQSLSIKEL